jgi:hypothetical protein
MNSSMNYRNPMSWMSSMNLKTLSGCHHRCSRTAPAQRNRHQLLSTRFLPEQSQYAASAFGSLSALAPFALIAEELLGS